VLAISFIPSSRRIGEAVEQDSSRAASSDIKALRAIEIAVAP